MGPAATVEFFSRLIRVTPAKIDQDHFAVVVWSNPKVPDRNAALLAGGPDPTPWLRQGAQMLASCGADFIAVPCNTAHAFLDDVRSVIDIPILSIIGATTRAVTQLPQSSVSSVGLLATTGTIKAGLYRGGFEAAGIDLLVPTDREEVLVMASLQSIKAGSVDVSGTMRLADVANSLISRGADVIVSGCSEVPLALPQELVGVPIVDSLEALAVNAVETAQLIRTTQRDKRSC
jgi:aspartate racemase